MRYVSCMGLLVRMTEKSYVRFLEAAASGKEWDVRDYGAVLGAIHNATDMTAAQAGERLQEMGREPPAHGGGGSDG